MCRPGKLDRAGVEEQPSIGGAVRRCGLDLGRGFIEPPRRYSAQRDGVVPGVVGSGRERRTSLGQERLGGAAVVELEAHQDAIEDAALDLSRPSTKRTVLKRVAAPAVSPEAVWRSPSSANVSGWGAMAAAFSSPAIAAAVRPSNASIRASPTNDAMSVSRTASASV